MSNPIIRVEKLSKRYNLQHQTGKSDGLRSTLDQAMRNPLGWLKSRNSRMRSSHEDFWALRDVTFDVTRGDVLGIIGRNGAGKSTLLKILSRITEPTSGKITLDGRVASLLEVGTGFHPDLTGRENIFLNGAILGMTRVEIRSKFDEIVAFAEVERFLDTPVKRYSSGMYVRLAFAVAAHLEPEILIVDEVLAVGDAQFQKKCLGKMQDVSKEGGRTVLFVSHNMGAMLQLTTKAILLNKGAIVLSGSPQAAVDAYSNSSSINNVLVFDVEHQQRRSLGTQAAKFISLRFPRPAPIFSFTEPFVFIATIRSSTAISTFRISLTIFSSDGTPVGSTFGDERIWPPNHKSIDIQVSLSGLRLAPGNYYCGLSVGRGNNKSGHVDFDIVLDTLFFEVRPDVGQEGTVALWHRNWGSVVLQELNLSDITG